MTAETADTQASYRNSAIAEGVSEAMIRELVFTFYGKLREDPELGPVFHNILGEDWGPHLETICAFWSAMMFGKRRYKRRYVVTAHVQHSDIHGKHLSRWLSLFRESAHQVCPPGAAMAFIDLAERVGESLKLSLERRDRVAG